MKLSIKFITSYLLFSAFISGIHAPCFAVNFSDSSSTLNASVSKDKYNTIQESILLKQIYDDLLLDSAYFSDFDFSDNSFLSLDLVSKKSINTEFLANTFTAADQSDKIESVSPPSIYNIKLTQSKAPFKQNPKNASSISKSVSGIQASSGNTSTISTKNIVNQSRKLISVGDRYDAEALLNQLSIEKLNNSWLLAEIASLYEQIKRYDKAIRAYEKSILLNPNRIEVLYSYALCLCHVKQFDKAETKLNKVVSINPNFTLAYYNLGNIYYKKAQYVKALNAFNQSIKLNPLCADAYFNTALTLETMNYKTLAYKYYNKCLELKPNDLQTTVALKRLSKA